MRSSWKQNESSTDKSRLSYLIEYLFDETIMKSMIGISGSSYDFTAMSAMVKSSYLRRLTRHFHYGKPKTTNKDYFYSGISLSNAVLIHALNSPVIRFTTRITRLFVPKFYHDRKDKNFLKDLIFVGEKKEIDEKGFFEGQLLGRKLYEYSVNRNKNGTVNFHPKDLDWPFPEKYYQSIGYTIHGFSFKFKNADNNLSVILNPKNDLINVESGVEIADNNITERLFSRKKTIEEKIVEYNKIPIKNFINENFFLYDKSNTIKKNICNSDRQRSINLRVIQLFFG